MGRKINPIGFRLSIRRDWKSRWYAKGRDFAGMVIKDAQAREFVARQYPQANISHVEIERTMRSVRVTVHSARPGMVIGKKGEGIERLRMKMRNVFAVDDVAVDIKEIAQPETNAKLIAMNVASQLERRIMFRRAMRRALANAMRMGLEGIKVMCAGRLNGIEIARTEWYREGRVPLHTLKNDIDYGFAEAKTSMGVVGVKVWVSHGDKFGKARQAKYTAISAPEGEEAQVVDSDDAKMAADAPEAVADVADIAAAADVAVESAETDAVDAAEQSAPVEDAKVEDDAVAVDEVADSEAADAEAVESESKDVKKPKADKSVQAAQKNDSEKAAQPAAAAKAKKTTVAKSKAKDKLSEKENDAPAGKD